MRRSVARTQMIRVQGIPLYNEDKANGVADALSSNSNKKQWQKTLAENNNNNNNNNARSSLPTEKCPFGDCNGGRLLWTRRSEQ